MQYPTIISSSKLSNMFSKIKELSLNRNWHEILSLYNSLNKSGVKLTEPSLFHPILKACSATSFKHGQSLHASVVKLGVESCTSIGNSIMDFYAKNGHIDSTFNVLSSIKIKDSVSWNIMICGYIDHGCFDKGMCAFTQARGEGFEPNVSTLVLAVQVIRKIRMLCEGEKMHGYMIKSDFLAVRSVGNAVLCMYADMGMEFARKVFDEMCDKDVVAWSVMVSGYVKSNEARVGLGIFKEMVLELSSEVDGQTIVSVLKACTDLKDVIMGRMLHGFVLRKGFDCDLFLGNSLVDMYSKCNDPDSALQAWKDMPLKNIVSWNSILSGLVFNEKHSEALDLFSSMKTAGIEPDAVTLVNILQLCRYFDDPLICKCIHNVIIRRNHELNELVVNTLIDVYAKCNLIFIAEKLFNSMRIRDTVSWSTMIAAFAHCGLPDEAIGVYHEMIHAQVKPNAITILNLIEACSHDTELKRPKSAHGIAIRRGLASEPDVGTAILDMYSRYGNITTSNKAFNQISTKNVISFSAMIAAYGMNGRPRDALCLLTEMEIQGLKPNSVTILSVLSACSHGGLIEDGLSIFLKFIKSQKVKPSLEHYACLVDLLSRGGKLDLAMEVIKEQNVGPSAWGALLSGCRMSYSGNEKIREKVVDYVLELEPNKSSGYMLASGMYAAQGLWDDAARIRVLLKDKQVKVVAGYSMVQVNNKCCRFIAGNKNQFLSNELRATIQELHDCMKIEEHTG